MDDPVHLKEGTAQERTVPSPVSRTDGGSAMADPAICGTLLIEHGALFSRLIARILGMVGWQVLTLDVSAAGTGGKAGPWQWLASRHVVAGFDCRLFQHEIAGMANHILDMPGIRRILGVLGPLAGEPENDPGRLRIAVYRELRGQVTAAARMLAAARNLRDSGRVLILPKANPSLTLAILCRAPGTEFIPLRSLLVLLGLTGAAGEALGKWWRRKASRDNTLADVQTAADKEVPHAPLPLNAKAIMLSHYGASYGNLFDVDYYFHSSPDHPLSQDNMLILEHTVTSDPTYALLHGASGAGVHTHLRNAFAALRRARLLTLRPSHLLAIFFAVKRIRLVDRFQRALSRFSSARLAVVGYEIQCPVEIVMAAQNLGITCVAVQERLNSLYTPVHAFVLDHYFVCGRASQDALRGNVNIRVGSSSVVGPIRSQWITDRWNRAPRQHGGKAKVLVLDSRSDPGHGAPDLLVVNSWENNALFLATVLRLADRFPEHEFIIRGKNTDWMSMPYFRPLVDALTARANLRVDDDYSRKRRSYDLVNEVDLIVARYTTLGDEALARGVPVVFYEQTVTGGGHQSGFCSFEDFPVYAFDFDALSNKVVAELAGKGTMPEDIARAMAERFYGRDTTDAPQKALLDGLNRLMAGQET